MRCVEPFPDPFHASFAPGEEMRRETLRAVVLFVSIHAVVAAPSVLFYDPVTDQAKVTCVYPISGQYGLMARVLYYSLLIFAVLARRQVWLVAGALGTALTFSGSAAIHAIVLSATRRKHLLDLDCFGYLGDCQHG